MPKHDRDDGGSASEDDEDAPDPSFLTIVTMGATMFIEVQNDGEGPAVRSADAERKAIDAAVADAFFRRQGRRQAAPSGGGGRAPDVIRLPERSGAELTLSTVLKARKAAIEAARDRRASKSHPPRAVASVVLVTGTDALEEFALALDWTLPRSCPVACVVTGAMRPASALCPDGPANLSDAIVAASESALMSARAAAFSPRRRYRRPGVLVAMGGLLHSARHVRKACSDGTAGAAFTSGPGAGPVGAVGSRAVAWAHGFDPPPPAPLPMWAWRLSSGGGGGGSEPGYEGNDEPDEGKYDDALLHLRPGDLRTRVLVWTLTMDAIAPPDALLDGLDGLVLAAPGAGSVASAVLASLAPAAASRKLPVVLVSRCGAGPSHDRGLYGERSLRQYAEAGLETGAADHLSGAGADRLTPLQARLALCVGLSLRAARTRCPRRG